MKKILITGPECSGKSSMANALSAALQAPVAVEQAREYLVPQQAYTLAHLDEICQLQRCSEEVTDNLEWLICDTGPFVLSIWALEKFGHTTPAIDTYTQNADYHKILLCKPDFDWEEDPLRENPLDRQRLFNLYELFLREKDLPYKVIEGSRAQRLTLALSYIK
jgi:nicotinamide riboside kinase